MLHAQDVYDLIIIGAGPSGLACAIEAHKKKLNYLILEKGCLVNSIYHFPTNLIFFSTPELLEIGDIPFIVGTEKPTRSDVLKYYRRVAEHFGLRIRLYEKVHKVEKEHGVFVVESAKGTYSAAHLVVATGQYDTPNLLNIPGENLDKVHHYYTEAHPYYTKQVAVIGGKNSAVEAALELYRSGARVVLIHRGPTIGKSVKYWIRPDIENRIKAGEIPAYFKTVVKEIKEQLIILEDDRGKVTELQNDVVFALTGYRPDFQFLRKLGVELDAEMKPVHDPETLQTNQPGVYIAGVVTAGCDGSKVFIENSRNHGTKIIGHILDERKK